MGPGALADLTDSLDGTTGKKPERDLAVAIAHDPELAGAPRVVAKGHGALAQRILEIAFANGVKVREDPDLAEALSALELDAEVPLEAIAAIAEVLAYLYRANEALKSEENRP
jgi:flagellar biosynthesis protein